MKIDIEYESSWRNSFLDGSNNEPVPKKGRKYIASMTNLKNEKNFIIREISLDTVMGVLNRLIGDQRKLYQSRISENYYFSEIENDIEFNDVPSAITEEMTYLRNVSGSTDQNSFTGSIKNSDPIFNSDYSVEFWGGLTLEINEVCKFITDENYQIKSQLGLDPVTIIQKLESINKYKTSNDQLLIDTVSILESKFEAVNYLTKKGEVPPISLYCSALYIQLDRLSNTDTAKTKAGGIAGISKRGFTKKDFMNRYTTGDKKKIWGNPYIREEFIKGEGKVRHLMTKASGKLEIKIDIERDKAKEIKSLIENAGVSSFYLGKKGLAYVTNIDTREVR